MGFSHEKTRHHFLLYANGGAIRVVAESAQDKDTIDAIRTHLRMISEMFSSGNFKMPMFIHATTVPGTGNMKRLRTQIRYDFHDVPNGAEVRISTENGTAIKAVHNFLWFQIKDHRTGDSTDVTKV